MLLSLFFFSPSLSSFPSSSRTSSSTSSSRCSGGGAYGAGAAAAAEAMDLRRVWKAKKKGSENLSLCSPLSLHAVLRNE
jgi:hypothetical protein